MNYVSPESGRRIAWNKGKLVGSKPLLKLKEIWAIRIRLELEDRCRDLALFNLAIDSKLRACDLVSLSKMCPMLVRCFPGHETLCSPTHARYRHSSAG